MKKDIQIDERDTMFSRMALEADSLEYEDYYSVNPEKKAIDDAIRLKPNLCSPGTATYHPILSKIADSNFLLLEHMRPLCEGLVNPERTLIEKAKATYLLKELAIRFGAVKVGTIRLEKNFIYSHRGRHKHNYGEVVDLRHTHAVVFAVEMNRELINRAPQVGEVIETSKAYVDAAIIGMQLAYYLRQLGYEARNHMDGNYLVHCVSMAYQAGLGEVGRNGLLTTPEFGSRVRLGIVTTDLELEENTPREFGLKALCIQCRKCIRTCPGKAIAQDDNPMNWHINQESCYDRWRSLGTDCGICICVCPISQKSIESEGITGLDTVDIARIIQEFEQSYGIRPYDKRPWPEEVNSK
jgi:ferredoxin